MNKDILEFIKAEDYNEAYIAADECLKEGDYDTAYEIYDEIYETVSEKRGRNSPQAFIALKYFGDHCFRCGKYKEALNMYEMYVDHYAESNSKFETDYYEVYNGAARIYGFYGEYEKAEKIRNEILTAYLEEYGEDSVHTIFALGELAFTKYISGQIEEALKDFQRQYEMAQKNDECSEEQYFQILQNIGRCYDDLGNPEKSLEYLQKAYDAVVQAHGEKDHDTMSVLNDIAGIYSDLGRTKEELETKEYIYNTMLEIVGPESPDTVMAMSNLASAYQVDGQFERAYKLKTECYDWFRSHFGKEHNDTLLAMENLAIICGLMNKENEALELRENVYRLRTKTKGADHPNTLSSALMLSYSYDEVGQTTAAMELAEDAYRKSVEIYGENSPALLYSISVLVLWYKELERYKESLELCDKGLRIYDECSGSVKLYHVGDILHSKSIALAYTKEYDEAVECAEENIDIAYKVYGSETSPYYLDERRYEAFVYYKAGKNEKALEIITDAINKQQECNITYPDMYSKKVLRSEILTALGRIDEAKALIVDLMREYSNESDVIFGYAKLMKATGDKAEAVRSADKCLELKKRCDHESHEYKEIIRFIDELK